MLKTLFGNLQLNANTNLPCDILQYYNTVFIVQVEDLLADFKSEEEYTSIKRRKMSMPDNFSKFEKESAFSSETNLYEPLKKTLFNNDTLGFSSSRFSGNKFISQSPMCSPMINKASMSATNLSRTPRTNRVMNSYLEIEKSNTPQQISNRNVFKGRILERLKSGELHRRSSLCKNKMFMFSFHFGEPK
jgi:hypothetical protein